MTTAAALNPCWHLPTRSYSPIDALNRRAAACGSPGYAMKTGYADYNGHHITLTWNAYRGYYVAEYFWAGRVVLARGGFKRCLDAVLEEYNRGALGSNANVCPRPDDAEALAVIAQHPELIAGVEQLTSWYTWRHSVAANCARDYAHPRALVRLFDWELLQAAESEAEYDAALKAKHGRAWA